jgi:uncharacterized Ntn-hydrolase superfamily protein
MEDLKGKGSAFSGRSEERWHSGLSGERGVIVGNVERAAEEEGLS